LAQRWLDAVNAHDADAVLQLLDAKATFQDGGMPAPLGPTELRQWLTQVWQVWPDQVFGARRIIARDRTLVIEWHVQQTHAGDGIALPLDGVTVLDVGDTRITSVRSYYDRSGYLRFFKP